MKHKIFAALLYLVMLGGLIAYMVSVFECETMGQTIEELVTKTEYPNKPPEPCAMELLGFAHYCLELHIIDPDTADISRYLSQGGWEYYLEHITKHD